MILKPVFSNPVSRVQVVQYKKDLVVKFQDRLVPGKPGGGLRGEITQLVKGQHKEVHAHGQEFQL